MLISECKVGDVVSLFWNATTLTLTKDNTGIYKKARILGHDPKDNDYLLGWKKGENPHPSAFDLLEYVIKRLAVLPMDHWFHRMTKVDDIADYHDAEFVLANFPVWAREAFGSQSGIRVSGGMKCSGGCDNFNVYAAPNQPDGTFKCYSCRQRA